MADNIGATSSSSSKICPSCAHNNGVDSSFCSKCGKRLVKESITPKQILLSAIVSLLVFGAGWGITSWVQSSQGRTKPNQIYTETKTVPGAQSPHGAIEKVQDPELDELRSAAEKENSPEALKKLGGTILERVKAGAGEAEQALLLEAVDVFSKAVEKAPEDPMILLNLADLTFEQKLFPQAVKYYERYLKLLPNELPVRARYASALAFVERVDEAIQQLELVLEKDPRNFQATAYLAISYAQKGDMAKAKETGTKALEFAPNPEAKSRLQHFLSSLEAQGAGGGVDKVIRTNPVAGDKFVKSEQKGEVLNLYFKNFPMQAMPPFAKEKFFGQLYPQVPAGTKEIVFMDSESGQELERTKVPER